MASRKFAPGFLLIITMLVSTITPAQQKKTPTPEERAKKLTEWMKNNLQLYSDQVDPVQAINLKYAYKMQELLRSSMTKMQKKRALKADGDARDLELKRNLTTDQFQVWLVKKEDAKKDLRPKMSEKGEQFN